MAVMSIHSSRLVLSQALRNAGISGELTCKQKHQVSQNAKTLLNNIPNDDRKDCNNQRNGPLLNITHQYTYHTRQLYPMTSPGPIVLQVQQRGRRSLHTGTCSLAAVSKPLLSSRRGRLSNLEDAKQYVASLTVVQKSTLEKALEETRADVDITEDAIHYHGVAVPSRNQLKLLCYQSALPFIGFGFLDNVIMITVGEYLDWTLGLTLGISTMAAAGLGNMISDLAGLGLADQVEAACLRLGIPNPKLSSTQLKHKSSRWSILLGRCVGIAIGCTIGMAPLYWIDNPHKNKDHEHSDE